MEPERGEAKKVVGEVGRTTAQHGGIHCKAESHGGGAGRKKQTAEEDKGQQGKLGTTPRHAGYDVGPSRAFFDLVGTRCKAVKIDCHLCKPYCARFQSLSHRFWRD